MAGKKIRCPKCTTISTVPARAVSAAVSEGGAAARPGPAAPPTTAAQQAVVRQGPAAAPRKRVKADPEDKRPVQEPPQPPKSNSRLDPVGVLVGLVVCVYLGALAVVSFDVFGGKPAPSAPPAAHQPRQPAGDQQADSGRGGVNRLGTPDPTKEAQPQAPEFSVSADAFYEAYNKSKNGQQKYDNKVGDVSGVVYAFGRVDASMSNVLLKVAGSPQSVECHLNDASPWNKLCPGQKARFRGKALGGYLLDAVLVETGPSPAIRVSARQLAKEYAADAQAADKKYRGKYLLVEGEVADKQLDKTEFTTVYLTGEGKTRILCGFPSFKKEETVTVQTGQPLTVLGLYNSPLTPDQPVGLNPCDVVTEAPSPKRSSAK
jgi:hypothetical protein